MGDRRKGRELALQALYQRDLSGNQSPEWPVAFLRHFDAGDDVNAFALALVEGVLERGAAIDALITEVSEHWRFERLSKIDLNVLRVATYELLATPDVPVSVVLNEAIEIARRFGTQESALFVNGVLDAIADRVGAKISPQTPDENGRTLPPRSH